MKRNLVTFVVAIILCLGVYVFSLGEPWLNLLHGAALAAFLGIVVDIVMVKSFALVKCVFFNLFRETRISAAYLYRIKVGSDYMLVEGRRFPRQYQPVGGVYKVFPESCDTPRSVRLGVDPILKEDATGENDLRGTVPKMGLLPFLEWFEKGVGREVCGWREFYSELIEPGILSGEKFSHCSYKKVDRIYKYRRNKKWKIDELFIFDVLELVLNEEQRGKLEGLRGREDSRTRFANPQLIQHNGVGADDSCQRYEIADHARWMIDHA